MAPLGTVAAATGDAVGDEGGAGCLAPLQPMGQTQQRFLSPAWHPGSAQGHLGGTKRKGQGLAGGKAGVWGGCGLWQSGCKRVCAPWQGRATPALNALSLPFPHAAMLRIAKIPQFRCLVGTKENLQSLAVPEGTLGAGDPPSLAPRGLLIRPGWPPGAVYPPNRALPLAMAPAHHRHSLGGNAPHFWGSAGPGGDRKGGGGPAG